MGINIRESRVNKFDRNKYFKGVYVENGKLINGAVTQGIFYSTDIIPLNIITISTGNVMKREYSITIETFDNVTDLTTDDYVLYSGEIWRVDNLVASDNNKNKQFSSRPSFVTTIKLVR